MSLNFSNLTFEETFCKSNWQLTKSRLTRDILNSFAKNFSWDELTWFLSSQESILNALANPKTLLSEENLQFLRSVIANRPIDPEYHKSISLETADGNKHPYLIRQWDQICCNVERIISEQNWNLSENNDNIIHYGQGHSSEGNTPFKDWIALIVD